MSISPTSVIITGASRGLGLELVRSLVISPPVEPIMVYACCRSPSNVKPSPPIKPSSNASIQWCTLDISDPHSVDSLASFIRAQCPAGLDVLINNAGVNLDYSQPPGPSTSASTIETNYDGTLRMLNAFLPLMRPNSDSRIVNVSSVGSKLSSIPSTEIRRRIRHAGSLGEVGELRDAYLEAVRKGREEAEGWPKGLAYGVSKAFINAATQVVAAENEGVLVNACCPGWCQTDMGGLVGTPAKTVAEGARIPLKLAFGDVRGVSGEYWENPSVAGKGSGQPSDWME